MAANVWAVHDVALRKKIARNRRLACVIWVQGLCYQQAHGIVTLRKVGGRWGHDDGGGSLTRSFHIFQGLQRAAKCHACLPHRRVVGDAELNRHDHHVFAEHSICYISCGA
jgi:hypothetical protein